MRGHMSVFILQDITKTFTVNKTENVVLNNINVSFPDTGLVSIVGKSGSGKSTLLNILMGIEKPTKGKVLFKGKNIAKFNDRQFSKFHLNGVSTVFQHYNLFDDLTALSNVTLPLKMKGINSKKAKQIAIDEFRKLAIEDLANRKVKNLSGGEKQRIAILRSVVTSPDAILCDEPTGALDFKNSREIMGILKNLSKQKLVIMVSHNKELVDEFSDYIVQLKDGKIVENNLPKQQVKEEQNKRTKSNYKSDWIGSFLRLNLKKNLGKNLFSVISCSVGFASLFLCVGFLIGSESSHEEALTKNLSIGNATVSKVESVEITDSPLTYQKTIRPELSEVDAELTEFSTIRVEENISYFISSYATCSFDDSNYNNFQMVPLYDFSLQSYGNELLIKGNGSDDNFEEIIVNKEFEDLLGGDALGKTIVLKNTASTNYKTSDEDNPFIKDQLIIEKPMVIIGVIKEFPFLNSPKIYYSYKGGRDFLKSQFMENLSYYFGFPYTYYDYLLDCDPDDTVSSYSSYIFLTDLSESKEFFYKIKNLNNKSLEITSTVADIKETYITFISSFSKTLLVFSGIAFIGINFILGMISLSSFLQNRKNTAIMTCLGSRNSSIYNLHLYENYIVIAISFLLSLFLAFFTQNKLNPYLSSKFSLSNLISIPFESFYGVKYGLIIFLSAIVVICSTIFTMVPMLIYRHGFITEELRDE